MKKIHLKKCNLMFLLISFFLIGMSSCKQENIEKPIQEEEQEVISTFTKSFYFQEIWYNLTYVDGVPVDSDEKEFIENLFKTNSNLAVNHLAGEPDKVYLAEDDYEFMYYIAEQIEDEDKKKNILFFTDLQRLTDELKMTYGNIYYNNDSNFLNSLEVGLTAICQKYDTSIPEDLTAFYKLNDNTNTSGELQAEVRWDICTFWEHSDYNGGSFKPFHYTTSQETTGDYGCVQDRYVSNFVNISKKGGGNWNDIVSSAQFTANEGADASTFTVYKHTNFNGWKEIFNIVPVAPYYNPLNLYVSNFKDHHWCWFCGSLNDEISSMKVRNIWSGCLD